MPINQFKQDFPIFAKQPDLVYLDSAATTLKPITVIAKSIKYYENYSANVARGLYPLSEQATAEYEQTRSMTAKFINASQPAEIIFTRGTTESINLLAYSLENHINAEDEILVTIAEHHSNFLPWQALAKRKQASLHTLEVDSEGNINIETLAKHITSKTKIFTLTFVSNVLGSINPVKEIIAEAKRLNPNIITVVDAAQAIAHLPVDVQHLGCDFLAFSAHKMFGPTGVGVLWGKIDLLESMTPFQYGGEMVLEARRENSIFKNSPHKFEAGTPNIAGVIAFQEAIMYIQTLGYENIRAHERRLLAYTTEKLKEAFRDDIIIFGPKNAENRSGSIAFSVKNIHPHDMAHMLGEDAICIRAGQHCTAPLHDSLHVSATARLSVSVYNTEEDINRLIGKLQEIREVFQK